MPGLGCFVNCGCCKPQRKSCPRSLRRAGLRDRAHPRVSRVLCELRRALPPAAFCRAAVGVGERRENTAEDAHGAWKHELIQVATGAATRMGVLGLAARCRAGAGGLLQSAG